MREPELRQFSGLVWEADDVYPGDLLICPGAVAYDKEDFCNRDLDTKCYRLARSPLLVVSRMPGDTSDMSWPHELGHDHYTTFVVLSRHGILYIIQPTYGLK